MSPRLNMSNASRIPEHTMDLITLGLYLIVCVTQLAMINAHEHFSKFQFRTFPKSLYKCDNMPVTFGEVSHKQEKQQIISYLDCFKGDTIRAYKPNITQERVNQFNEALRMMTSGHWRVKRQGISRNALRSEVRSLSPRQWRLVTTQFNRIFNSGIFRQITSFHSDNAIGGAHGGPAFLGWHRILLLWIEYYLALPVPYWDSSLDFHITDPTLSILWTRFFFGNGRGTVRTGPFRTFTEPNGDRISRNIGRSGTLIARENIESILNRTSNRELIYTDMITLEGYHNGPHVWVGNTLMGIVTAPADPCFWFHHSFVDKLWSDVQRRMVNPEAYPYETSTNRTQHPREPMAMFPMDRNNPLLNEDGYMNWVARRAGYRRSPGQATQRSQCENPTWRNRRVLVWDNQRRICITGEGDSSDFDTTQDIQSTRLSASAFNNGFDSSLKFTSPLIDARTLLQNPLNENSLNVDTRGTAIRSAVFNDMFVSPVRDMRTFPSAMGNGQARELLVGEIMAQLQRRQNNLMAQSNVNSINSIASRLQLPFEGNVFRNTLGQQFGQTGQLIGQTGGMIGHPQTGQQGVEHVSGLNLATSTGNNRVHALLTRALQAARQRNNHAHTIGSINLSL